MKTIHILLAALLLTGVAFADTLTVGPAAKMGGTTQGLIVSHDNSSPAYVQDDTPNGETVYRFEYLFNPNNISPETGNFRQSNFIVFGPNPRPNNPNNPCPTSATVNLPLMRVFLTLRGGSGQTYTVTGYMMGNQCGNRSTDAVSINKSGANKICGYLTIGAPGEMGLTVVGENDTCPSMGDPSYTTRTTNNNETNVTRVRLGIPGTNNFGVGENGDLYFDEFQSFRTLAP